MDNTQKQVNPSVSEKIVEISKYKIPWSTHPNRFINHMNQRSLGFMMLFITLVVATVSIATLFPRRVTPANAAWDVFSGERAMAHLAVIASEPHPVSSPALANVRNYLIQEIKEIGLEVEIQRVGRLENVVARLHGSNPTGVLVILAHYDTASYSPGAGDNSSGVAVLLELMRSLAAGPTPMNDVIALFDDSEEVGPFAGTKAFVQKHPWMSDIRVAISIDSAVAGFIATNEVGPKNNGWLVHALSRAYNGGVWSSFSGGGQYDSTPFSNAGIQVLAIEDNYPYKEKHTSEDTPDIVHPASVQQMGEQVLSITRVLGNLDLSNTIGEQETFFSIPNIGFFHYPESWSSPLAIGAGIMLIIAIGMALWRDIVSWRGMAIALGTILAYVLFAVIGINLLWKFVPDLMQWKTFLWPDWPEVIPPNGWFIAVGSWLLVMVLAIPGYILTRRWITKVDFSVIGLLPFTVAAIALAYTEPRTAYEFTWPVLIGSVVWITAAFFKSKQIKWVIDIAPLLAALPLVVMVLPFLPGIVMSDGMKSLNILAGLEALLLGVTLPVVDNLLIRQPGGNSSPRNKIHIHLGMRR